MWGEVPPGVSSFYPPSPSFSIPCVFSFSLFSSCMRDKASCQTLKPPRSSSYRKLGLAEKREEQARGGGTEEGRAIRGKTRGLCKGGKRVLTCARACACSFYIVNDLRVHQSHGAFRTSHKPPSFDSLPAIFLNTAFCGLCQTYLRNYLLIIY